MDINAIEILLTVTIVAIQISVFCASARQIRRLQVVLPDVDEVSFQEVYIPWTQYTSTPLPEILGNLNDFSHPPLEAEGDEDDAVVRARLVVAPDHDSTIFTRVAFSLNKYLLRNTGGRTDFRTAQSIVDRQLDAAEEQIEMVISVPLYLGLMGTMLGIVIGLFSMSDLSFVFTGSSKDDLLGAEISALLGGVKIAMIASFVGLLLTTVSNAWLLRSSKRVFYQKRDIFSSLLETEIHQAGSGDLSGTFDSLHANLTHFNASFSTNVERLSEALDSNIETLTLQKEVISSIKDIDLTSVAEYNINVLKEIRKSTAAFDSFNKHLQNVDSFVENSGVLADRLLGVLDRTDKIQSIFDSLHDRLTQSEKLLAFLSRHFETLEDYKKHTTESVVDVGSRINEVFKELEASIKSSRKSLEELTVSEFDLLKDALSASRTNLSNLEHLEPLQSDVALLKDSTASQSERIRQAVEVLGVSVKHTNRLLGQISEQNAARPMSVITTSVKKLFGSNGDKK